MPIASNKNVPCTLNSNHERGKAGWFFGIFSHERGKVANLNHGGGKKRLLSAYNRKSRKDEATEVDHSVWITTSSEGPNRPRRRLSEEDSNTAKYLKTRTSEEIEDGASFGVATTAGPVVKNKFSKRRIDALHVCW
ncbi:unnamed protein product [Amoebophrya sp. A25]|nr:unnamed protein product [Amoebophrya sp. A25]|eukprot:GSA25T00021065001.1